MVTKVAWKAASTAFPEVAEWPPKLSSSREAAAMLTAMESCMMVESRELPLLASALGRSISVRVFMQVN